MAEGTQAALAALEIAGAPYVVDVVRGRAATSTRFAFEVHAHLGDEGPSAADLLGQPFVLTLEDRLGGQLRLGGCVEQVEKRRGVLAGSAYELRLGPEVSALDVGRDLRVFTEMSAQDVIEDVLRRGGVLERTSLSILEAPHVRPYVAQHRESDWAFVERLAREEGLTYHFEPGEDATTLVFSDDTTQAADLPGGAELSFQDAAGLGARADAVVRLTWAAEVATNAVRLRDYNPATPKVLLESTAKAGSGDLERYDAPAKFPDAAVGDRRARHRLDAEGGRARLLRGEAGTVRLLPGYQIAIDGHPLGALNGRFYLLEVTWELDASTSSTGRPDWGVRFVALPADRPYRPPPDPCVRWPGGPQTGLVVGASGQEIHPDDTGRVRVQMRWDRLGKKDDTASTWMRVGQLPLGGSMILPRIGWDVLVHHGEGDVDAPMVTGHLYDGEHPVPYALPDHKTRTAWQTATTPGAGSTNEIRFEDRKGSEELFLNASKDMNVVVGNDTEGKVGVDHQKKVGGNETVQVGTTRKTTIGADQIVDVGGDETLTVGGARNVEVGSSETTTIGGSRTQIAVKGISVDAKGGRTLTVAGSMIGASAMEVGRSTLGSASVTIGGALVQAAASGVSSVVLGACAETIGGTKIQAAGSSCGLTGKGAVAETVGGAYVVAAAGNAGVTASGALRITVGGAFIGNAPTISLEAESEIVLRVGGASLTIKPGSVELKAPAIASPTATIDKGGSTIEHN